MATKKKTTKIKTIKVTEDTPMGVLKKGYEFNTMTKLCEFMGWKKPKSSNEKISIEKQLGALCEYKVGVNGKKNNIVITRVFQKPKTIDNKNVDTEYRHFTKLALMYMLSNVDRVGKAGCFAVCRHDIFECLNFCNPKNMQGYKSKEMNLEGIPRAVIDTEIRSLNRSATKTIEGALNELQKQSYLQWSYRTLVIDKELGKRPALDEEVRKLLTVEREVLKEMKCWSKTSVWEKNRWTEFKSKMKPYLDELNIENYYSVLYIIPSDQFDTMVESTKKIIDDIAVETLNAINKKTCEKNLENAQERYKVALEEEQAIIDKAIEKAKKKPSLGGKSKYDTGLSIEKEYNSIGQENRLFYQTDDDYLQWIETINATLVYNIIENIPEVRNELFDNGYYEDKDLCYIDTDYEDIDL